MSYWRALPQTGPLRPIDAVPLAGGWTWFTHIARLERGEPPEIMAARDVPPQVFARLTQPRAPVAGLTMDAPRLMGILNATPDSFSDGGLHEGFDAALTGARRLIAEGVDILDIGGESTRPGATEVPIETEIARTAPVIEAIRAEWPGAISIDTRKAAVAEAAAAAGATMLNDVSAMTWDAEMAPLAAASGLPICLMHAQGDPQTMQDAPRYGDVLFDVYDHLDAQIATAEAAGIDRSRIVVDPGIGFGKTLAHNLTLLANISLFHTLGCPILLGASRKRFIGTIAGIDTAADRMPGSIATGLAALAQGVQILRVHDMAATAQATALWRAATTGDTP